MKNPRGAPVLALLLAVSACRSDRPVAAQASAWPDADAMFHQDARWLGADAAYSVDLGDDRVLWLFGDTFVATTPAHLRSQAKMPRNTVGVQTGKDPSHATMAFSWRETAGAPASFFAEDGATWFWPGPAVRVGGRLIVSLMRVGAETGGLGFRTLGARAVTVRDPSGPPSGWTFEDLPLPSVSFGAILSAGGWMQDGDFLYAYAPREPGDHALFLARWSTADAAAGDLSRPSWYAHGAWVPHAELSGAPDVVMRDGQTELSITHDEARSRYVEIQVDGFGGTNIAMRTAPRPEGPWSRLTPIYRPPESDRAAVLVYSAKAHPELTGADLLVTYASNSTDFSTLVADSSLYYPRFVRFSF